MSDIAIRVEGLSKQYRIGDSPQKYRTVQESISSAFAMPFRAIGSWFGRNGHSDQARIWALKEISFEVKKGDVVGVIGRNGAGKSTLLKILSRITQPSKGLADIHGRVGSLLEIGTGFHTELTGRENTYLNGAILGMRRREIDDKFDEIVAFAEIDKFIDTPVKHYSSGMYLRLAFAVAAHLETEILLVDEVLAVGDAEFQKKCIGKMSDAAKKGRTVLFVSHNMAAIQSLCRSSILLNYGKIDYVGPSQNVIQKYFDLAGHRKDTHFGPDTPRIGNGLARFTSVRLLNAIDEPVSSVPMGSSATVELRFNCTSRIGRPIFGVYLNSVLGQGIIRWKTNETHGEMPAAATGGIVRLHIDRLDLLPGIYSLNLICTDGLEVFDFIESSLNLEVTPHAVYPTGKIPTSKRAIIFTPCKWSHSYS